MTNETEEVPVEYSGPCNDAAAEIRARVKGTFVGALRGAAGDVEQAARGGWRLYMDEPLKADVAGTATEDGGPLITVRATGFALSGLLGSGELEEGLRRTAEGMSEAHRNGVEPQLLPEFDYYGFEDGIRRYLDTVTLFTEGRCVRARERFYGDERGKGTDRRAARVLRAADRKIRAAVRSREWPYHVGDVDPDDALRWVDLIKAEILPLIADADALERGAPGRGGIIPNPSKPLEERRLDAIHAVVIMIEHGEDASRRMYPEIEDADMQDACLEVLARERVLRRPPVITTDDRPTKVVLYGATAEAAAEAAAERKTG